MLPSRLLVERLEGSAARTCRRRSRTLQPSAAATLRWSGSATVFLLGGTRLSHSLRSATTLLSLNAIIVSAPCQHLVGLIMVVDSEGFGAHDINRRKLVPDLFQQLLGTRD